MFTSAVLLVDRLMFRRPEQTKGVVDAVVVVVTAVVVDVLEVEVDEVRDCVHYVDLTSVRTA